MMKLTYANTNLVFASMIGACTLFASLWTSPVSAQVGCEPESYSADPAEFSGYSVDDFQDMTPGFHPLEGQLLERNGVRYTGSVGPVTGWCIPGMDSGGTCGGDNVYLSSGMNIHLAPTTPSDVLAFRYGTQGQEINISVTLSDGSTRVFNIQEGVPNRWGGTDITGFFGYCTGDASLTIADVHITAMDGGIDDVQAGVSSDTGTPGGPTTPAPVCSLESLMDDVNALDIWVGKKDAMLQELEWAGRWVEWGYPQIAANMLRQFVIYVEIWRGEHIPAEAADNLLTCANAMISDMQ